jgi:putative heme-binding domain-containing protein
MEFLASTDNFFRPVNFINAPDGTLQVVDMYREVVEGPSWVPADLKESGQVNVMGGADKGRIYRIVPVGYTKRTSPALAGSSSSELVELLGHTSSWWRETAQRLIVERQDNSVARQLRRQLRRRSPATTRIHLAWTLDGLGMLAADDVKLLLADSREVVQRHGIRLSSRHPEFENSFHTMLARFSGSDHLAVTMECLAVIADLELEERQKQVYTEFLSGISQPAMLAPLGDHPAWLQRGVVVAATGIEGRLAEAVLDNHKSQLPAPVAGLLQQLCLRAGAAGDEDNLNRLLQAIRFRDAVGEDALTIRLLAACRLGEIESGKTTLRSSLDRDNDTHAWHQAVQNTVRRGLESGADMDLKIACISLADLFLPDILVKEADRLISVNESPGVRAAAVKALARLESDQVLGLFLEKMNVSPPGTQSLIMEEIFRRSKWTRRLLNEIKAGELPRTLVTLSRQASLQQHPDADVKQTAIELYGGSTNRDREEVIVRYLAALKLKGNADRGSEIFKRECTVCHRFGALGHDVGPNLSAYGRGVTSPEGFLRNILDPNRNVPPDFMEYSAVLTDGRVVTGLLRDPTPTTVTFRRDKTESTVVPRVRIDEIKSTGKSFMPEGLEKKISVEQMADLLAFLARVQQRL